MSNKRFCVIMAGGIGSRFWPISREQRPKQFLDILGGGETFIRTTFDRFKSIVPTENFMVITNTSYKDLVLNEIPELKEHQVLCEPIGRNTAPAIAYAAFRLNAVDPDSEMIVTPSDHLIFNQPLFEKTIKQSLEYAAESDVLMTIGIRPTHPNTGYGYIQVNSKFDEGRGGIVKVRTFTEKPNLEMAKTFIESGEFYWNSGIFIWKTRNILSALERHLPNMFALFDSARQEYNTPTEDARIKEIYSECKAVSIDIGVMERSDNVSVYCSNFGWSDIGTWGSLYEYSQKDEMGNVLPELSEQYDTKNCIIKAPSDKLVVVEGLSDFIVVDSGDVLMICPKENEQNIKKYIEDVRFKKGDKFV